jgi:hypothetical protein
VYLRGIPAADYIRASDQRIEVLLEHERAGGSIPTLFEAKFDHLQVVVVE